MAIHFTLDDNFKKLDLVFRTSERPPSPTKRL